MNGFDDLMLLLRLVSDPEAVKSRLEELQAAGNAAAARQAEAVAAHGALEGERERLAKLEANLREREVVVYASEQRHAADLEKMRKWLRDHTPSRLIAVGPGGLMKEPDDTEIAPDPIDDPNDVMDLDPIAPAAVQTHSRKGLRRIRV
jgi:hypothetical protein